MYVANLVNGWWLNFRDFETILRWALILGQQRGSRWVGWRGGVGGGSKNHKALFSGKATKK